MRRALMLPALCLAVSAAAPALAASVLSVPIDHAVRLTTPSAVSNIFIGNPAVADVAVINSNTLVVIGKGHGQTNLMVLDRSGRTILTREIRVSAQAGQMTLYRGAQANAYSCSPNCQATAGAAAAPAPTGLAAVLAPPAAAPPGTP